MTPPRHAAFNRRTKNISGEQEQAVLLAVGAILPPGTLLVEHRRKLRNINHPTRDFLLRNTIHIVEMQDLQSGHRTKQADERVEDVFRNKIR